jgi:nucleoid-associated protein YgaU
MWGITDWALGSSSTPARIAGSWTQIWAVNRATIGDNPSLIYPGQRFRVPRLI